MRSCTVRGVAALPVRLSAPIPNSTEGAKAGSGRPGPGDKGGAVKAPRR